MWVELYWRYNCVPHYSQLCSLTGFDTLVVCCTPVCNGKFHQNLHHQLATHNVNYWSYSRLGHWWEWSPLPSGITLKDNFNLSSQLFTRGMVLMDCVYEHKSHVRLCMSHHINVCFHEVHHNHCNWHMDNNTYTYSTLNRTDLNTKIILFHSHIPRWFVCRLETPINKYMYIYIYKITAISLNCTSRCNDVQAICTCTCATSTFHWIFLFNQINKHIHSRALTFQFTTYQMCSTFQHHTPWILMLYIHNFLSMMLVTALSVDPWHVCWFPPQINHS